MQTKNNICSRMTLNNTIKEFYFFLNYNLLPLVSFVVDR